MADLFEFTRDTRIQDALEADDRVIETFKRLGMKCVDKRGEMCVAAEVEILADAARYHEIDLELILSELKGLGIPAKKGK